LLCKLLLTYGNKSIDFMLITVNNKNIRRKVLKMTQKNKTKGRPLKYNEPKKHRVEIFLTEIGMKWFNRVGRADHVEKQARK